MRVYMGRKEKEKTEMNRIGFCFQPLIEHVYRKSDNAGW